MTKTKSPVVMPALALRGLTIFPNMLLHFDVGREASIKALDEAMARGQPIFLVAQREITVETPSGSWWKVWPGASWPASARRRPTS